MPFINVTVDQAVQNSVQNFANPSWDTFLILFFAATSVIYAFFVSRERLAVVLLSTYSSLAVVQTTPLAASLLKGYDDQNLFHVRLAAFVALFLVMYVLLSHNMTLHSDIGTRFWQAFVLSVLQVGLLISSILSFIPRSTFTSVFSEYFFTSDIARSAWLLLPIVAMVFMRNKHGHSGGSAPRAL